jgi:UDP-glucose 4-epimerase
LPNFSNLQQSVFSGGGQIGPRRNGDIIAIWAETTKGNNVLGWSATRNLETMMRDAWNWQLINGQ